LEGVLIKYFFLHKLKQGDRMDAFERMRMANKNTKDALACIVTDRDFEEAVNALAMAGEVKRLAEAHCEANRTAKVKIAEALINAAEVCAEKGKYEGIPELLDEDFPKEIRDRLVPPLCKIITAAGERGDSVFLAHLLGRKNVPKTAMALVEPALIRSLEVYATKDYANIYFLCELRERKDISEDIRRATEPALIAAIEGYGKGKYRHGIIYVLGQDSLPEDITFKAIEVAAKKKWFDTLASLIRGEPLGEMEGKAFGRETLSEAIIIKIAEIALDAGLNDIAACALGRKELSDDGRIRMMERLGAAGFAEPIADLLEGKPSPPVKDAAEKALIKALESYGGREISDWGNRMRRLLKLRGRSDLPVQIRDAIEPALIALVGKIEPDSICIYYFADWFLIEKGLPGGLKAAMEAKVIEGLERLGWKGDESTARNLFMMRDSLSPPVRDAAERAYKRCVPADVIGCYLEQQGIWKKASRFFGIGKDSPACLSVRAGDTKVGVLVVPPGCLKK
jgi:hypothetical protein